MERPPRNPGNPTRDPNAPTEGDVYATAMLHRQMARTSGKATRELAPGMVTGDNNASSSEAGLIQMSYIAQGRST